MRAGIVWTVLRREWYETVRNRLLMSTIILPPILLTVAPIVLASAVGERALPPELAHQVLEQRPEWSSFTPAELAGAFAVQQFLVFFLLMPAYIPLSIATFSIIGEKQARSSRSWLHRSGRRSSWPARRSRHSSRACWPAGRRT
jgi:ABC-2 type transport system permease protein